MPHLIATITLLAHNGAIFHRLPHASVQPFPGETDSFGDRVGCVEVVDLPESYLRGNRVFTLSHTRAIEGRADHAREAVYRELVTHGDMSKWARDRYEARYA